MKDLFRKFQKPLVNFCNHPLGRKFLKLRVPQDKKVAFVFPNGLAYQVGRNKVSAHVYIGQPVLAKKLSLALTSMDIVSEFFNGRYAMDMQALMSYVGLKSSFFYPMVHFATTNAFTSAGDGNIFDQLNDTWAQRRADTTGSVSTTTTNNTVGATPSNSHFQLTRAFIPASFSALSGTITSATFNGYVDSVNNSYTDDFAITPTSQASISVLATTDLGNVTVDDSPEWCDRLEHNTTNFPLTAFKVVTINATGLTAMQTAFGGDFKAGYRAGDDLDDTAPSMGGGNIASGVIMQTSSEANPPYYEITYTPSSGGGFIFMSS